MSCEVLLLRDPNGGERLMLMFSFMGSIDAYSGGGLHRSPGFAERYGEDPVRKLVVPRSK